MLSDEGELKKLLKELVKDAKKHPNHEFGRLQLIRLKIEEAKKEFPKQDLLVALEKGTFNVGYSTFAENVSNWFLKYFGDSE